MTEKPAPNFEEFNPPSRILMGQSSSKGNVQRFLAVLAEYLEK